MSEGLRPSPSYNAMLSATADSPSVRISTIEQVELNGTIQGIRVKIFLWNNEERSLFFQEAVVSAGDVCVEMAKKEMLRQESTELFSLWIIGNGLELQLKPKQDLLDIVEKFPRYVEKYMHDSSAPKWRFVYKREAMVTKENDRKVKDPMAIKLLFSEGLYNVISSRYPLSEEDAFALAGIQMQINYGDHVREVMKPGFLLSSGGLTKLQEFIPKHFFTKSFLAKLAGRVPKPADWEERILTEHQKHAGKPAMIAQLLYLQFLRQWPFYGSTFFTACFETPPRGFFEYRDRTILVGVNAEGIHIIDGDNVKLLQTFSYDDINWDCTSDTFTIESGDEDNIETMLLITPQANLISSLVSKAIKNLNKNDRRLDQIRLKQGSSSSTMNSLTDL